MHSWRWGWYRCHDSIRMTHRRAGCCEFAARHSCRGEVARAQHRRELDEIAAAGESMGESLVSLESVLASTIMGAVRRRD